MPEYFYKTRIVSWLLAKRRKHRVNFMLSHVDIRPGMSILDIGCGPDGRSFENYVSHEYMITGIDIIPPENVHVDHPRFQYHQQDASDLSRFETKSFDLAVSIGMMEHICDPQALEQMANEMMRVSKQWIVVVPWRYCWIEPHFKFPFFQLLPENWQIVLTKIFNLHGLGPVIRNESNWIQRHYQWLTTNEWKRLLKADHVYLSSTLDTIAVTKRH